MGQTPLLTCFQFLGIPPKGERIVLFCRFYNVLSFQFLGIPPKGELDLLRRLRRAVLRGFQFLGIPPKGEPEFEHVHGRPLPFVSNF